MKKTIYFLLLTFSLTSFTPKAFAKLPVVTPESPLPSNIFIELNKVVNPAVVNISTETRPQAITRRRQGMRNNDPMEDLFKQFFGGGVPMQAQPSYSLGTGFIIKENGLILTNSHVVDKADVIKVKLSTDKEKTYTATVIGKDPKTDIALIKIKAPKALPVAKLGTSDELQVGEWVAAFGNPFGHENSMSKGIVSAIGRDLDDINLLPFIQTDASINPGNSGGPLVNLKGEVIGVNTAIDARAQGIGFAIPIDEVKPLIRQLETTGMVTRGFLGVQMQSMNPYFAKEMKLPTDTVGALIANVVPNSAAQRAGIKPYDVITQFNSYEIKNAGDLSKAVSRAQIGKTASITIIRQGEKKVLNTQLGKTKNEKTQASKPRLTYPDKAQNKDLIDDYGFDLSELDTGLKNEYEIGDTGKHKVVITKVVGYSKASRSGLRAGDVIYDINMKPVFGLREAKRALKAKNRTHLIRVKRGSAFILARLD